MPSRLVGVRVVRLLVGVLAIVSGAAITVVVRRVHLSRASSLAIASGKAETPHARAPFEEEIAVLFGSPGCGASSIAGLSAATKMLIDSLHRAATARGDSFATMGVSLDGPVSQGEAWLAQFGEFDEVVIGRNWLNSAAAHFIWADPGSTPAIPQLLLVRHGVNMGVHAVQIGRDTVLRRWVGVGGIAPNIARHVLHADSDGSD